MTIFSWLYPWLLYPTGPPLFRETQRLILRQRQGSEDAPAGGVEDDAQQLGVAFRSGLKVYLCKSSMKGLNDLNGNVPDFFFLNGIYILIYIYMYISSTMMEKMGKHVGVPEMGVPLF
jgi:hypothetical protein